MTVFFKPYGWLGRAFRLTERRRASVNTASRITECDRCCVTARAIEYVRHQWIAAGIDWE